MWQALPGEPEKSLTARLEEILPTRPAKASTKPETVVMSRIPSARSSPSTFTDARLQGIRFLTETMIKDLEV